MFDYNSAKERVFGDDADEDQEMVEGPSGEHIEFVTGEQLHGVIPEPEPAANVMPDWYKDLDPATNPGEHISTPTVRRCGPFLDALSLGWIIKSPADIEVNLKNPRDGPIDTNQKFNEEILSTHHPLQLNGDSFPMEKLVIQKWHTYWSPVLPEGYSLLMMPPMNRMEHRFQVFSGVGDFDDHLHRINIPFIWRDFDFRGVIPKGTPIVQVVPIKRDALIREGSSRARTEDEDQQLQKNLAQVDAQTGYYREEVWEPKASRMTDEPDEDSRPPFLRQDE